MASRVAVWTLAWLAVCAPMQADEGMFPISELPTLDLTRAGLTMDPGDIFNTSGDCLVDAIVRVNGCTGSFVSPKGLIITNHHCAYAAIQKASTTENDYLRDGFWAPELADELPAPGYTVRITESFSDVSAEVLGAVQPQMSYAERTKAIDRKRKELEKAAEAAHPGQRAEVAEMFTGERYVLFLYTFIKDVRLVFAPPSSVGNFGGEVDNWEWPRHTGDFSFMRAYVAPDGSSADYSPNNVPYQPKRHLEVQTRGANEGDFVMLLGYPGRTVRHATASFLEYEQNVRLPAVVAWYGWQIAAMEAAGKSDRAVALKLASRIKSLANVEKRSRGQLMGLQQIGFVDKRRLTETTLRELAPTAAPWLDKIDNLYRELAVTAPREQALKDLVSASQILNIALTLVDAAHERQKDDLEREANFTERNWPQTQQRLLLQQQDLHLPLESQMLEELVRRLTTVTADADATSWSKNLAAADDRTNLLEKTRLTDRTFLESCWSLSPAELAQLNDPALNVMLEFYPDYQKIRETDQEREGQLSQWLGELTTIKREYVRAHPNSGLPAFVPDANATLRLTYGHVRGYSPRDAVYMFPMTSVQGMLDKVTGKDPFECPSVVQDLHQQRNFGDYMSPTLLDVPVSFLYSTDTTGGNSGSPVLNGAGQLVGVNFDRTFNATINDFAWDEGYSRSIGVDIRYVLWITQTVYSAERLIQEMSLRKE